MLTGLLQRFSSSLVPTKRHSILFQIHHSSDTTRFHVITARYNYLMFHAVKHVVDSHFTNAILQFIMHVLMFFFSNQGDVKYIKKNNITAGPNFSIFGFYRLITSVR